MNFIIHSLDCCVPWQILDKCICTKATLLLYLVYFLKVHAVHPFESGSIHAKLVRWHIFEDFKFLAIANFWCLYFKLINHTRKYIRNCITKYRQSCHPFGWGSFPTTNNRLTLLPIQLLLKAYDGLTPLVDLLADLHFLEEHVTF